MRGGGRALPPRSDRHDPELEAAFGDALARHLEPELELDRPHLEAELFLLAEPVRLPDLTPERLDRFGERDVLLFGHRLPRSFGGRTSILVLAAGVEQVALP